MTWTYTGSPSTSSRDAVRFLMGDTDNTDPLVLDEEIAYALTLEASSQLAAARVAETLAAKFSRFADQSVGDLSISYSQRVQQLMGIAKQLRSAGAISSGMPYAGGVSKADKIVNESNTDRVQTASRIGVHNNPGNEDED